MIAPDGTEQIRLVLPASSCDPCATFNSSDCTRRGSNPQPTVPKTVALSIELLVPIAV